MGSKLESKIQQEIVDGFKKTGHFVVRLRSVDPAGIPDLLIIKDGVCKFIEVKRKGCDISPLQEFRIAQLEAFGIETLIIKGKE